MPASIRALPTPHTTIGRLCQVVSCYSALVIVGAECEKQLN